MGKEYEFRVVTDGKVIVKERREDATISLWPLQEPE